MKFATFALLVSTTQAATALVADKSCIDAATYKAVQVVAAAFSKPAGASAAEYKALVDARIACKTNDGLPALEEPKRVSYDTIIDLAGFSDGATAMSKITPAVTTAESASLNTALDLYGEALGMGKASCVIGKNGCTTALKGTFAQRSVALNYAFFYFVAVKNYCAKDVLDKTRCTKLDADLKVLKEIGTEFAAQDYISKKTTAEQATWLAAYDKRRLAAAAPTPAAGAVGFSCKAAAVVAPATVGVRPACGALNCCMGVRKTAEDKTNASETCQLKTATKAKHETTPAGFSIQSGFIYQTTLQVEAADYVAACIEGAVRNTSAALSVLAAAYMMA